MGAGGSEKRKKDVASSPKVVGGAKDEAEEESAASLAKQIVPPFVCAGLGMVLAGLLLDRVQRWPAFSSHPELFTLVPALLGLKGNLEMTLASRLSTLSNTGALDSPSALRSAAAANLALVQAQGIVVGAVAAAIPAVLAPFTARGGGGSFPPEKALLLAVSSIATASVASFLLGLVMIVVVAAANRWNVNPDNVATPIAASLGDLVTLALLATAASLSHSSMAGGGENGGPPDLLPSSVALACFLVILPAAVAVARGDPQTGEILQNGWTPVLAAMGISSAGGKILERAIQTYPGIASYQPVINGVAGNLVAVQASRLSTNYHQKGELGEELDAVHSSTRHYRTAKFLLALVIPGHLLLNGVIGFFQSSNPFRPSELPFLTCYLASSLLQVWILLAGAGALVRFLWLSRIDPDNAAIPYLTAAGDLLGGVFLATTFYLSKA